MTSKRSSYQRSVEDSRRDPQAGVSDVTQLLSLTEESVMQNTMVRFSRDEIYTFVGAVLLAVNPYKRIPHLYGEEAMEAFERCSLVDVQPHVYAVVEGAYRKAAHNGGSQSLIISGESGAGKTESTKLALSYLVWRTRRLPTGTSASAPAPPSATVGVSGTELTTSILQANPVMEAFGNACTSRNSNSSRFGKCIRLGIDPSSGVLLGGQVHTYLLEKSRVTTGITDSFGSGERNFHAFYQLLAGVKDARSRSRLPGAQYFSGDGAGLLSFFRARPDGPDGTSLGPTAIPGGDGLVGSDGVGVGSAASVCLPAAVVDELGLSADLASYRVLAPPLGDGTRGASADRDRVDDLAAFRTTYGALVDLGCSEGEIHQLLNLLAALLHLGNGGFEDDPTGKACAAPGPGAEALASASKTLRCDGLADLLLHRSLKVRGEMVRIDLRAEQADKMLCGLIKSLYTLGFAWLVRRVNDVLNPSGEWPEEAVQIDILDIFGFENFEVNSFEQLCINFANEKLHQLFLYTMFKAEEAVVARERVSLPPVEYCDNARCLQMLEDAPRGIFHQLDTCCRVHASAASFCLQVHEWHADCEFLVPSMNGSNEDRAFIVRHFAGDVAYLVDDFPAKNTETMETQTRQVLQAEGLVFLRSLMDQERAVTAFAAAGEEALSSSRSSRIAPSDRGARGRLADSFRGAATAAGVEVVGRVASSTGKRFMRDMSRLMSQLQASSAHFVHCVKPNGMEQPELLSYEMVAEQLTSLGTLETVQLMGLGFPVRIKYETVRRRYLPRLANIPGASLLSPKLFAEMILEVCDMPPGDFKLGVSRLFLRHRAAQVLESLEPISQAVLEPLVRQKVSAFWDAASRIRDRLLTYHHNRQFREFCRYVLIAQKYLRMWLSMRRYRRTVAAASTVQHAMRSRAVRLEYLARKARRDAALTLQARTRGWLAMREYLHALSAAATIQAAYRRKYPPPGQQAADVNWGFSIFASMLHKLGWARAHEDAARLGLHSSSTSPNSANLLLAQLAAAPGEHGASQAEAWSTRAAAPGTMGGGGQAAEQPPKAARRPSGNGLFNLFGLIGGSPHVPPAAHVQSSGADAVMSDGEDSAAAANASSERRALTDRSNAMRAGKGRKGTGCRSSGAAGAVAGAGALGEDQRSDGGALTAERLGMMADEAPGSAGSAASGGSRQRRPGPPTESSAASGMSASMPLGWRRFASFDGRPYFFNPSTGTTQWEPPILRYEMEDELGGTCYYYYDPLTRRTSWVEPDEIAGWQLPEKTLRRQSRQGADGAPMADGGQPGNGGLTTAGGAWPGHDSDDDEDIYADEDGMGPMMGHHHYHDAWSDADGGAGSDRENSDADDAQHERGDRHAQHSGTPSRFRTPSHGTTAQRPSHSHSSMHTPRRRGDSTVRRQSNSATPSGLHLPRGWGSGLGATPASPRIAADPEEETGSAARRMRSIGGEMTMGEATRQPLAIKDLDTGRTIPFEHADMLWQPLLVRDLDANILLPFAPDESRSAVAEEMLNPPPEQMRFMSCSLERSTLPPPLSLPEYRLYKVSKKRKVEMFSACRRADEAGSTHFDVRWQDGVLHFTGKLQLLPTASSSHVQELAMYDDYINYYGFPRELGFIRTKQLLDLGEAGVLIELIIPRVSPDGAAAQFRVNAVPGHSMLSMYKQRRAREHMFVLRGRLSILDSRALVELRHRDEKGRLNVVLQAKRMRSAKGGAQPWRVGFAHPLSAFQTFCVLLALHTGHG